MSKKEYCKSHPYIGIWQKCMLAVFIHGFEYGVEDYAYASVHWGDEDNVTYHRVKLNYLHNGSCYIRIYGSRFYLNEFIRRWK